LMTNNFLQRFIARLAIPIRKERRERARDMLLKATRRPSSAHKVTNSHTLAENHRKGTGPTARKAPHNISLQKASATVGESSAGLNQERQNRERGASQEPALRPNL